MLWKLLELWQKEEMKYPAMIPRICCMNIFDLMIERTRKEPCWDFSEEAEKWSEGNSSSFFSLLFVPPLTSFSFVFYSHNPFLSIFVSFLFSTKLQGAHDAQCEGKCMNIAGLGLGVEIVAFSFYLTIFLNNFRS